MGQCVVVKQLLTGSGLPERVGAAPRTLPRGALWVSCPSPGPWAAPDLGPVDAARPSCRPSRRVRPGFVSPGLSLDLEGGGLAWPSLRFPGRAGGLGAWFSLSSLLCPSLHL